MTNEEKYKTAEERVKAYLAAAAGEEGAKMKPEYKHQCRYCAHCVCGDAWWCDLKSEYCTNPKRPNRCSKFLFNEIPADDCSGNRVYNPRKKRTSQFAQPKLFDMPTDKQRKETRYGK